MVEEVEDWRRPSKNMPDVDKGTFNSGSLLTFAGNNTATDSAN